MAADTQDPRKPRGKAIQIKGPEDDPLLTRLYRYADRKGLQVATAARMLLKAALDVEESRRG